MIDLLAEHGEIKNLVLNLDRRTGHVKGYALVEYSTADEAKKTIATFDGREFQGRKMHVSWAFKKAPAQ